MLLFATCAPAARAALTNDLIAHYRFNGTGEDSTGRNPAIHFEHPPFVHGWLYTTPETYHAVMPLRGLDYEHFTLSLDFYPFDPKPDRRLNPLENVFDRLTRGYYGRLFRRASHADSSNILTGGTLYRWFNLRRATNGLQLTLNNQKFQHTYTGVKIQPRRWHNLMCSVDLRQGRILTFLDGDSLELVQLPEKFKLEAIGSPGEDLDRELLFANYGTGSSFFGYAANLKVFGRVLGESDLNTLYFESAAEHPRFNPQWAILSPVLIIVLLCAGGVMYPLIRFRRRK